MNHVKQVAAAASEIGAAWTGTWFGWGALAMQWLQILALVVTIVFTVLRIRALIKGREVL